MKSGSCGLFKKFGCAPPEVESIAFVIFFFPDVDHRVWFVAFFEESIYSFELNEAQLFELASVFEMRFVSFECPCVVGARDGPSSLSTLMHNRLRCRYITRHSFLCPLFQQKTQSEGIFD